MAKQKLKRNVYKVRIPTDLGNQEQILNAAILEAQDRAQLYVIPATWEAKIVEGSLEESFEVVVQVTRWHR